MDRSCFEKELARLAINMGKDKWLEDGHVEILYDELSFIPTEAWPDMITMALGQWDTWPRNFPKMVKQLWYDWQGEHKAEYEKTDCQYCHDNSGIIFATKQDEKTKWPYSYAFRCGHCENWRGQLGKAIPRHTVTELKEQSYVAF